MNDKDFLNEEQRAEDILLGACGFGEEAVILNVERCRDGYRGKGRWADQEEFEFKSDFELGELENWALAILCNGK